MIGVKGKQLGAIHHFHLTMHVTFTFDLLTPISIGHILDSWGVFVMSFIMIGVKGKQLCDINHFQLPLHCDLDLSLFDPETHRVHSHLMESLCMKFHDDRCKGKAIMQHKPFSVINAL